MIIYQFTKSLNKMWILSKLNNLFSSSFKTVWVFIVDLFFLSQAFFSFFSFFILFLFYVCLLGEDLDMFFLNLVIKKNFLVLYFFWGKYFY